MAVMTVQVVQKALLVACLSKWFEQGRLSTVPPVGLDAPVLTYCLSLYLTLGST